MKAQSLLKFALCAALLPFALNAEPERKSPAGDPPKHKKMLQRLDTNQNGTLSKEEAKGALSKHFDQIDSDGNGELTKDELQASSAQVRERAKQKAAKIKEADTDGNGTLSKNEAETAGLKKLVKHFDKLDADNDGEVTKEELKAMRRAQGKKERQEAENKK